MNPIALVMIVVGTYLLLRGILLYRNGKRAAGLFFSILGLITAAVPFAVTYFLTR